MQRKMRRMRQKRLKLFNNLSFFKKQNAVKLVPAISTPWSRSGEEVKPWWRAGKVGEDRTTS